MDKSALLMEERKGAEQVKFDRVADMVEGVLLGVGSREVADSKTNVKKTVGLVTLAELSDDMTLTGREFEFLLSADLRAKVRPMDRGKFLQVRYSSDMTTNNGKMKVFEVKVSKNRVLGDGAETF